MSAKATAIAEEIRELGRQLQMNPYPPTALAIATRLSELAQQLAEARLVELVPGGRLKATPYPFDEDEA